MTTLAAPCAIREEVRSLTAYTLEPRAAAVKLDQNESSFEWDDDFRRELVRRVTATELRRYPDFEAMRIRSAIAAHYRLDASNVLVGNGSNEMLLTAFIALASSSRRLVVPTPTFALYEKLAAALGADVEPVAFDPASGALPVDEICATGSGSLVVLCSPNNPTGASLAEGDLARVLDSGAFVLLDRAYADFAGDVFPPLHERLVVFSTFSKAWGLAAMRVGWLASTAENCRELRKVKLPYNLNVFSQEAATLALERADEVIRRARATAAERDRVFAALARIDGVTPFPSSANFIAFRTGRDATSLFEDLVRRDVLVRDVSRAPGMERCLRVTIGRPEENDFFLEALRAALSDEPVRPRIAPVVPIATRSAQLTRVTKETDVRLAVDLDSVQPSTITTPVGFLSHMLEVIAKHGRLRLDASVSGDVEIDYHHTVEDTALVLGDAVRRALGAKRGIRRFGSAYVPLDESLARVVIDFSGRPFLSFDVPVDREMLLVHKDFPFALVEEFFKSFANACGCNVHIDLLRGRNGHHAAEAIFKAFALALRAAKEVVGDDVPSTKGVI